MISLARGTVAALLAFIICYRITEWYYDAEATFEFVVAFNVVLPIVIGVVVALLSWRYGKEHR